MPRFQIGQPRPDRVIWRQHRQGFDGVHLQHRPEFGQFQRVFRGKAQQQPAATRAAFDQTKLAEAGQKLLQTVRRDRESLGQLRHVQRGLCRHIKAQHPIQKPPFKLAMRDVVVARGQPVRR